MANKPVIALLGPTASGKTAASLALAARYPIEIISMDSALVYRGMDIGTAKPSKALRQEIPHHLIDIVEPWELYSAASFVQDTIVAVDDIMARGKVPLLVGGTVLYYKALADGLNQIPATDPNKKAELDARFDALGYEAMKAELDRVDPVWGAQIALNDRQRLLRGLAVYEQTGKPISSYHREAEREKPPFDLMPFAQMVEPRSVLHQRIAERFQQMLEEGFLQEVETLLAHPNISRDSNAMRAVGYRQAIAYLHGEDDYANFVEKGIAATRQLAKRQLTWLRSMPEVESHLSNESLISAMSAAIESTL